MPPPKDVPNILRGPGDYEVTTRIHNDTYPEIDPRGFNLAGMAVFITGGSRGLGRAMALSFAKAGASKIAVGARSEMSSLAADIETVAAAAHRSSPLFLPLKLDVTDESSVAAAAAEMEAAFGKLDILVNNAGISGPHGLIGESDPKEWWRVMDINVRGSYLVTRASIPLLLEGSHRCVVNVAGVGAHLANPTMSAYQISKLALLRLCQMTNVEYSGHGLVSFCIHPGNFPADRVPASDMILSNLKRVWVDTPELGADSVVYLAAERRTWLGGRYINCTWDLPELMARRHDIVRGDKLKLKFDFTL